MQLSIIIPVYKETLAMDKGLAQLDALNFPSPPEIIVVDGESAAATLSHLKKSPPARPAGRLKLLRSAKGRGPQMNAGAEAARGELLLFLHADTRLDQRGVDLLARAWERHSPDTFCGAFDLAIDQDRFWFRIIEKTASLRSRLTRLPYGDQGIFISKQLFNFLGGFPRVPIMEDVGLMQKIKGQKLSPTFVDHPVYTSARRWEKEGVLYTTLRNWCLISLYFMGASPDRLVKFYR